ncbi:NAD-dependent aldehyde dehydrogenase [Ophiocordyceps camponoti-floridani]|uniref:NAD-dependent aldehyde dehydrogenase n=1 Tax=Ophiocordyceps camponoti-floridani TaxID=2030778 RepID=A0A8H4VD92_9HYPO|nr:NAD-dependent aldehyde dehydrogenase [Ophiocordyceps camponoti-floridani]
MALENVVPLVINGKDVTTTTTFPVTNPATNEQIWTMSCADKDHVQEAVRTAHEAFEKWSRSKAAYRRDLFLRAADVMVRRRTELTGYMRDEVAFEADFQAFIFDACVDFLRDIAGRLVQAVEGSVPESIIPGMRAMVCKRPYGVILGTGSWNGALLLGLRSVAYALAAGNTAIFKGSELSPKCHWAIADVFREAGLPDGCLNFILHSPSDAETITDALVAHPLVKKINFTGSTRVGRLIAANAGKHLKPVLLELGGKASAIVLKDADLENAAVHCVNGAFMNSGQICMSTERILVHQSIADKFRNMLVAKTKEKYNSSSSTPTLINPTAASRNRNLISQAVEKGARLLPIFAEKEADTPSGMQAVVLENVNSSMDIYGTESFGPSVSLFTFESEAEAIKLANDSEYGLTAAVFSEDLRAAFRTADALESGAVHINSMTVHDESSIPHGGVKNSGFGRFNSSQGLDEFMYYKSVTWME